MSYLSILKCWFYVLVVQDLMRKVGCELDLKASLKYHEHRDFCDYLFDTNQCSFLKEFVSNLVDSNFIRLENKQELLETEEIYSVETIKHLWKEIIFLKEKIRSMEENEKTYLRSSKTKRDSYMGSWNKSKKQYLTGRNLDTVHHHNNIKDDYDQYSYHMV